MTTCERYLMAVDALGPAYRGDDERLIERVAVTFENRGHSVKLKAIRALVPGRGDGDRVLARLCALADEYGVTLTLEAGPLDRQPDTWTADALTKRLQGWYKRHGFRGPAWGMIRRPQS